MTLAQIRGLVKRNTSSDTKMMPDAAIDFQINLAQKEIVRRTLPLKKNATVTTVADQEQYDLPSDFHKAVQMKVNDIICEYRLEEQIDRLYTTDIDEGTPYYYYIDIEAGKYGLFPRPTGVLSGKFAYRAIPATMSDDADTPDIPELYHDAIVLDASCRVAHQLNNLDLHNHFYALYMQFMDQIDNDIAMRATSDESPYPRSCDILDLP